MFSQHILRSHNPQPPTNRIRIPWVRRVLWCKCVCVHVCVSVCMRMYVIGMGLLSADILSAKPQQSFISVNASGRLLLVSHMRQPLIAYNLLQDSMIQPTTFNALAQCITHKWSYAITAKQGSMVNPTRQGPFFLRKACDVSVVRVSLRCVYGVYGAHN